ncbi:reverse transcriptase family protein [Roseateles sp. NT4]|uniref:reverse transcriptase family protein n=1 Tax=Roseateles sp. NT4 TaxID=3453715 RepID=UPI003EEFDBAD
MTERMPTRMELLARIAASSKDAVVLSEMQRLGYWPADAAQPTIDAALLAREKELNKAFYALQEELRVKGDPQAALEAMRRERMARAREQREARAQARERQRYERALRWHETRKTEAGYLGEGVSGGLGAEADPEAVKAGLLAAGLPALTTPLELAQAMGLSLAELKFLCFHREVARSTHYRRFNLPKKTGGVRTISAPMPRLKRAQYWVLDNLLAKVPCHAAAHGFLPGRSIVSNAVPHCGQDVVINLDLKDFFPSIHFPRIKGVFRGLGYGEAVASLLALLCSENACDELTVDGERFFVGGKGHERVLPQGAPTSPMLTNLLCRKLDRRLAGLAGKLGFGYTRYADDLTFSASGEAAARVGRLLRQVHHVLGDEGFTPHPDKQRVMRRGARQEVTGVVVNAKPSVSREERRKLRAALHRAGQQGLQAASWQGQAATRDTLVGYARFVHMVNAQQGQPLLQRALALSGSAGPARKPDLFRNQAAKGQAPARRQGDWWLVAPPPEPQLALTAGQMKAARQQRLNTERAARNEAKKPSPSQAASARTARAPQPSEVRRAADDGLPPVLWGRFAAQLLGLALLALSQRSAWFFILGVLWLSQALKARDASWLRFGLGVVVLTVVTSLLKAIGKI